MIFGDPTAYNVSTGTYTVPTSGFYGFHYMMQVSGELNNDFTLVGSGPLPIEDGKIRGEADGVWNGRTLAATGYFAAGTQLNVSYARSGGSFFYSTWKVRAISLVIVKY